MSAPDRPAADNQEYERIGHAAHDGAPCPYIQIGWHRIIDRVGMPLADVSVRASALVPSLERRSVMPGIAAIEEGRLPYVAGQRRRATADLDMRPAIAADENAAGLKPDLIVGDIRGDGPLDLWPEQD